MFYGYLPGAEFGLPIASVPPPQQRTSSRLSPPPSYAETASRSVRKQSRCVTTMMLEFPIFLYGLMHLIAATFGIVLLLQVYYKSSLHCRYFQRDIVNVSLISPGRGPVMATA